MTDRHRCPRCRSPRGHHSTRCPRCGWPDATGIFDLADQELGVGDVFRWPCGTGARTWRIADVLDPHVDELTQRVRAVPVRRAS